MAKKVLIVEDEPDEARSIQLILQREGYDTEIAVDGDQALEKVGGCDVMLLDIILPRMHGDAVLRKMRDRKVNKPVVVVTAVSREVGVESDLRKINPGITFIQKPFNANELVKAIKEKAR